MPNKTKEAQVRIPWRVDIADAVQDLVWSPDGRWLAVAEVSGPLLLIHGESGAVAQRWPGHVGGTLKLAWSRDSRWLASSGQDGAARLWNPDSAVEHRTLAGGNAWVGGVSFSPYADDRLITAAGKELRAWTLDGGLLQTIQPHASTITDLAWHPQQPLLASSAFGKVHLWDWQTPDAPGEQSLSHSSPLLNVRWSPDGRYLACWTGYRLARSLRQTARAIERIKGGELTVRLPRTEVNEIGILQDGVNLLAETIAGEQARLENELAKVCGEYDQVLARLILKPQTQQLCPHGPFGRDS